jgi:tetratricopeptide (TPR) repeat protein
LWLRGEWTSLLLATAFSLLLNAAVLATFVWPEWLGAGFSTAIWPVLGGVWLASLWASWRQRAELFGVAVERASPADEGRAKSDDRLFIEAQAEYLRGNLDRAGALLQRQLQRLPRDAPSRLLLATLFRRSGRLDEAEEQLIVLGKIDEAVSWLPEIGSEQRLIERDRLARQTDEMESMAQDLRPASAVSATARAA